MTPVLCIHKETRHIVIIWEEIDPEYFPSPPPQQQDVVVFFVLLPGVSPVICMTVTCLLPDKSRSAESTDMDFFFFLSLCSD